MRNGALRIWWVTDYPKTFYLPVDDGYEAQDILDFLAKYDEHLGRPLQSKYMAGFQVFDDGGWVEWKDEQGNPLIWRGR